MSMLKLLIAAALLAACLPVCHADAVSPRRLLEVADIASPTLSPDGRSVAFRVERAMVARNTYDAAWYVQGLDDPWPRRVADGGVPLRDSAGESLPPKVVWSPDNRWIYYRALIGGKIDVWRAAADGSDAEPMTHDVADVRDFALVKGGRGLRYSVGATREEVRSAERTEYDQGIHVDASVPVGQALFRSGFVGGRMATQRYGKVWFDRVPLLADVPDRWVEIDLATGARRVLAGSDVPSVPSLDPGEAGVDGDPWKSVRDPHSGRVAWLTRIGDREGQQQRPGVLLSVSLPAHANRAIRCVSELCVGKAITGVQWFPGRDEVLFTITDPHQGLAQSILRWNIETGAVLVIVKAGGLANGGRNPASNCGVSARSLVCVTAKASSPPRLERIDLGTGERQVLFDPNAALALDMAKDAPSRLLRWRDAKGQEFTGQFFSARHSGQGPLPLFVNYYDCRGFLRGGLGDEWPFASLAARGISALCINAAPYVIDPARRFDNGLAAVEGAVKLLSISGEIDCAKVGMGGLSFGSEVTMWVAMKSRLLAVASVSSVSVSPNYYLFGSLKGDLFENGLKKLWGLGSPEETPRQWHALSPVYNLERISVPILFQMPEQEYMQATDYVIPMIRKDMADLYVFPDEPHQKFQPKHKLAIYRRNIDWLRFWLQGHEDVDPSKAIQYARWHTLREHMNRVRTSAPACKMKAGG